MRIALVTDTLSVEKGTGIARYGQELLSGFSRQGLAIEAICPQPPNLPFGPAINHALKMPYEIRRRETSFDLIHATSPITALAFPLVKRPKVVTYFDLLSLLCDNTSVAVYTRLFAPLFLRIGRFADRIIAISSQTKEELVEHLAIPAQRITVVNLGVGDAFRPRPKGERSEYVVGYLGALNRRKGLPYLLRSFNALREAHPQVPARLIICGRMNGEYPSLVQLAAELELDQSVEFTGSLPEDELVDAYNSFDVFAFPSEWEGFGLPILEAQRCGVPVIIRREAHIPPEVSKRCLKAGAEEDMAAKIYEVLTDADLRQSVIEQGSDYSQQFTWERTAQETLKVYEEVLS